MFGKKRGMLLSRHGGQPLASCFIDRFQSTQIENQLAGSEHRPSGMPATVQLPNVVFRELSGEFETKGVNAVVYVVL